MSTSGAVGQKELMLNELDLGVSGLIVVMVCRMWDVNSAAGRYLITDFIVSDKKGNLMHCTARGNIAHNFLRLKEGLVYSVRNFTVQSNKDDFRVMRTARFMFEFDGDTVIKKSSCSLEGFDRFPFQFMEFDSLEPTNNKYLIDAVGYVTNVGRTTIQKSGSRTLDFYLANGRGQSVRVTCWGALGDMLIEKRTRHVGLYPVVLTALSVKLYNNRIYLSSTPSSVIIDDLRIPVLKRLKTNDSGVELTREMLPPDSSEAKPGTLENLLMWARNRKYDSSTFHCTVTINKIKTKKGWNYPSCGGEKCKKGNLDRKYGKFWCDSCDSAVDYPVMRFRLELEISDATAETVVVMFDETAKSLVKCSAGSIAGYDAEGEEEVVLPPPLANIMGSMHTLELKSHTYFEHSDYERFTCWRVVEYEDKDESGSSATVAPSSAHKSPRVKSLAAGSSIPTPSKMGEPKPSQRHDLEDSDVEESAIAGTDAKKQMLPVQAAQRSVKGWCWTSLTKHWMMRV